MKGLSLLTLCLTLALSGCALSTVSRATITSVVPSSLGTPSSNVSNGAYEFVSVQGTGQIFTYDLSTGLQVLAVPPYATPCADPSGMVVAGISGSSVMAVACYDTGSLLTLSIHADGSLTALGSVGGLGVVYPGLALDGTNVFVPIYGQSLAANGGVARISIAVPASPIVTGMATLASPMPGAYANPGFLTVANGHIFVAAGSESQPQSTSSTIQVVDEQTMSLVGSPLTVEHSPQQIAIGGTVAYATIYDEQQLLSIDISNPASLQVLENLSLNGPPSNCRPLSVALTGAALYVGCYAEGVIEEFNVVNPSAMQFAASVAGVNSPQRLIFEGASLLAPASIPGGAVFDVGLGLF